MMGTLPSLLQAELDGRGREESGCAGRGAARCGGTGKQQSQPAWPTPWAYSTLSTNSKLQQKQTPRGIVEDDVCVHATATLDDSKVAVAVGLYSLTVEAQNLLWISSEIPLTRG